MSGLGVHLTDLQQAVRLDRRRIRALARRTLIEEGSDREVSLVYVDDERIRELNRRFLGHDRETDVIAFPLEDEADALLGEVIVSTEVAVREARKRHRDPMDEVLLYTVHGILHLLGYDDRTPSDAEKMRLRQSQLL